MYLNFNYTSKLYFHFSDTFFLHTFLSRISKTNENITSCDKNVNENYLKHTLSLHLFRHKGKLMWLGNEHGR